MIEEKSFEKILRRLDPDGSIEKRTGNAATGCALESKKCAQCKGAGFVFVAEGMFCKAKSCECLTKCMQCQGAARKLHLGTMSSCRTPTPGAIIQNFTAARIPARYLNADFGSFSNFTSQNAHVVQSLSKWTADYGNKTERGMLLAGPVGVGKTFLLCAMAKALALRGFSVRFTDFFQLLAELRGAYADGKGDPEILEPLRKVDVLFIDELGKGRATDWEMSIADTLVSDRYNAGKIIVASTNYLLKEAGPEYLVNRDLERDLMDGSQDFSPLTFGSLEVRIGKRIFSRLVEMTQFVEMSGKDFRKTLAECRSDHRPDHRPDNRERK